MMTDLFIRRPVLAIAVSLFILILGLAALFKLPVRQYPAVTTTVVSVRTAYPGADADLIQGFLTTPLEQSIAQANNIDHIHSQSSQGLSVITVTMQLDSDPHDASADVLSRVNAVRYQLPPDAEDSTIITSTGAETGIVYLGFSSDQLKVSQITDYLERIVKPQLFSVNGVGTVDVYGDSKYALRVWLDSVKMASHNLSAPEITDAIKANNYLAAIGKTTGAFTYYNAKAGTQTNDVTSLAHLIVAEKKGQIIRLEDIATVSLSKSHDNWLFRRLADHF